MNRLGVLFLAVVAFFSVAALSIVFSQTAYADDACSLVGESDPLLCGNPGTDEENELIARVGLVLNTVYLWIGILAVIFIVVGGVKYMTSAGSIESIKSAKSTIMYAVIGLIITILAFAITSFIIGAINGSTEAHIPSVSSGDRYTVKSISVVESVQMTAGQSVQLKAHVVPDYATNKDLTYTSSDESIATVDKDGKITAKKDGDATITIASSDGPTRDVKLTVQKPVAVQDVFLDKKNVKLGIGKSEQINARIIPSNAADKTLIWVSTKPKIATVTQTGKIKALALGNATITVTARNQTYLAQVPQPTQDVQLAATGNGGDAGSTSNATVVKNTPIIAKVEVKVVNPSTVEDGDSDESGGDPGTQGAMTNKKYSGRLKFTSATQKTVEKHKKDFNCSNYKSYLKNNHKGSYKSYVKSLGGIFAAHANDNKISVKTAADFQVASEYTFGLWTIWGTDYNNLVKYRNWGGSDGFYSGSGGSLCTARKTSSGYAGQKGYKSINGFLESSKNIRTHCNGGVNTLMKTTNLAYTSSAKYKEMLKHGKKITNIHDLQVGDIFAFFKGGSWRHTAIVNEVYKDYVVTMDAGSSSMKDSSFKRKFKRVNSSSFAKGTYHSYSNWYAVRLWKIDQSKTLKGLE